MIYRKDQKRHGDDSKILGAMISTQKQRNRY